MTAAALTLADAARMMREALKDKTYRSTPLGLEVAQYLRYMKNQRDATSDTLRDYESTLAKLALDHADLELTDFEPPVGIQRVEEFLYARWEHRDPRTFSKNTSILVSFFDWAVKRQKLYGNPARPIDRPRKRKKRAPLFAPSLRGKVINGQVYAADRVGCRLILIYGLRRSEIARVQLKHLDFERHRLRVYGKGRKEREVPIAAADTGFWEDVARWQAETGAGPDTYLLYRRDSRRTVVPVDQAEETLNVPAGSWVGKRRLKQPELIGYATVERKFHDRELTGPAVHRWWYRCLERALVVAPGVTAGENMHRGRHTAITEYLRSPKGDLKLAQLLAGHSDIRTTADIYDHRDVEDLAEALDGFWTDED